MTKQMGKRLVIGVVYDQETEKSLEVHKRMAAAFRSLARKVTVQGKGIDVVSIPYATGSFAKTVKAERISVLYVTPGLDDHIADIGER